jgi:hypothetical protein
MVFWSRLELTEVVFFDKPTLVQLQSDQLVARSLKGFATHHTASGLGATEAPGGSGGGGFTALVMAGG